MSKVLFNGKVLREPRSATALRVGIPPVVNPGATNRVLVIGPSEGGLPVADSKVYTFTNASEAAQVLRSGDSLRAIGYIFNPSPAFGGASEVDFIRMDQATGSTLALSDGSGTALTLSSVDKGLWTNLIRVSVANGAVSGKVITIQVPTVAIQSGTDATVAGSVLTSNTARFKAKGARVGDFIYLGTSPANAQVFSISSVDSDTQVTLTGSPTVGTSITWQHFVYDRTQVSPDLLTNTDIVNWISDNCSDVLTAAVGTAVAPTNVSNKNMGSGTVTLGGTTEITNALAIARTLNVQHIYVARACGAGADELEFSGLVRGHLLNDAEVPAIGYIGAGVDESISTAITYAGTLNSAKLVYCTQSIIDTTIDGLSTEKLGGYFLAAKVCGLAAGLPPQTPLSRKEIDIKGISTLTADKPLDRTKRENLLKAGVLHVFQQPGTSTFVINQGITTIQKQDNLWDPATASSPEISLNRIANTLLYSLQASADSAFIGTTASLGKAVVENFVRSYLEDQRGLLITDWRNLVVTQSGDQWRVEFGFIPNNPINYVLIVGTVIG